MRPPLFVVFNVAPPYLLPALRRLSPLYVRGWMLGLCLAWAAGLDLSAQQPRPTWVAQTSGTTETLWGATYGGNQFVVVGEKGTILTSSAGDAWTARASGTTRWLLAVAWSAESSRFVAVGDAGTILTSPDAVVWTARSAPTTQRLNGIAWGGGTFLAVGEGGTVLTSPDGLAWTARASGDTGWLRGVAYGNGAFALAGHDGTLLTTADGGATFRRRGIATTADLEAVLYYDEQFYVAGARRTFGRSSDLAYWPVTPTTSTASLRALTVINQAPLLVGDGGLAYQVANGDSPGLPANWRAAAANSTHTVLAGVGGAILRAAADPSVPGSLTLQPSADSLPYPNHRYTIRATALRTLASSWQWSRDGRPIAGATGPDFTISSLTLADAGSYTLTAVVAGRTFTGGRSIRVEAGPPALGQLDLTFQPALPTPPDLAVPLPDGRLYVAAGLVFFEQPGGRLQHGLARLRSDGSVDPTFDVGRGLDPEGALHTLTPLADGGVALTGSFTSVDGVPCAGIARLRADGSVERAFQPAADLLRPGVLRAVLPDGRWIASGAETSEALPLVRYLASGAPDPSYPITSLKLPSRDPLTSIVYGFSPPVRDPLGRTFFQMEVTSYYAGSTQGPTKSYAPYRLSVDGILETLSGGTFGNDGAFLGVDEHHLLTQYSSSITGKAGGSHWGGLSLAGLDGAGRSSSFSPATYGWTFPATPNSNLSYGFGPYGILTPDGVYANASGVRGRNGIVRLDAGGELDPDFRCELVTPSFGFGYPIQLGTSTPYTRLANGQILLQTREVNHVAVPGLARLNPDRAAGTTRLGNLSIRARTGVGPNALIVGFVTAHGTKKFLLRGAGPALTPFGVADALPDPQLTLYSGSRVIAANDDWPATTAAAATEVGAFAFAGGSRDAALLADNPAGPYTIQLSGKDGATGVALAEIYDVDPRPANARGARLANFSARTRAGPGDDTLIAGFTIDGTNTKTVLIRAIGPSLAQFDVPDRLANPVLTLYRDGVALATNDDWGVGGQQSPYWNDPAAQMAEVFRTVGAFLLDPASKDAAIAVTLTPGTYSVHVSSASGAPGVALLEVYEVP